MWLTRGEATVCIVKQLKCGAMDVCRECAELSPGVGLALRSTAIS